MHYCRDAPDEKRDFDRLSASDEDPLIIRTTKGKVRGVTLTAATGKKVLY